MKKTDVFLSVVKHWCSVCQTLVCIVIKTCVYREKHQCLTRETLVSDKGDGMIDLKRERNELFLCCSFRLPLLLPSPEVAIGFISSPNFIFFGFRFYLFGFRSLGL